MMDEAAKTSPRLIPDPGRLGSPGYWLILSLVLAILQPALVSAQEEISVFRLTDVSGNLRIEYLYDDQDNGDSGFETRGTWEQQLSLDTRSYIYHPGLLNMRLGGGPLLVQQQFDSSVGSNANNEVLWNADTEFNFLDLKAYPFTLYFGLSHPSVTTSLSGRFLTKNEKYGARGRLDRIVVPVIIRWGVSHWNSVGSGFNNSVNDEQDKVFVATDVGFRRSDRMQFKVESTKHSSLSGSLGLPIQESSDSTDIASLSSINFFGERSQVTLGQSLNLSRYEQILPGVSILTALDYQGNVDWELAEDVRVSGLLGHRSSDRDQARQTGDKFSLGLLRSRGVGLDYRAQVRGSWDTDQAFERDRIGGEGWTSFSFGNLRFSASLSGDRTDQRSGADEVRVFDETLTLVGTAPVGLANEFVEPSSIEVTNIPKTQVFVEGLDYRLIIVGSVTSVQRLVDGNIADGQAVLVSYSYQAGGTVKYDTVTSSLSVTTQFSEHLQVYARYNTQENSIISGTSTTPFNDLNQIEVGGSMDRNFFAAWNVGGDFRFTQSDENISPYTGETLSGYIRWSPAMPLTLKLSSYLYRRDIENSDEDVNSLGHDLNLAWRFGGGGRLNYLASLNRDTGGSRPREERRHSVRYDWAYRQLRAAISLVYVEEILGDTRRDSTRLSAQLFRAF